MIIENTLPTNHDKKPQTKNKQKIATDSKLENPNRELKANAVIEYTCGFCDSKLENPNRELKAHS